MQCVIDDLTFCTLLKKGVVGQAKGCDRASKGAWQGCDRASKGVWHPAGHAKGCGRACKGVWQGKQRGVVG